MSQRSLIIIGAVVLVVAIAFGGVFLWRLRSAAPAPLPEGQSAAVPSGNGSASAPDPSTTEGEEAASAPRGCAERESAEACSDAERYTAAVAAKDAAQCADIGDAQARDLCVAAAAEAAGDAGQCDRIAEDAIRTRCTERAITAAAVVQGDPSGCAALGGAAAEACEGDVFTAFSSAERCAQLPGEAAARCVDHFAQSAPPAAPTPLVIPPASGDEDGDGLANGREIELGSDPLNRDTDGDGFSDGDEVKNGYSPTGPGRLETAS